MKLETKFFEMTWPASLGREGIMARIRPKWFLYNEIGFVSVQTSPI